MLDTVVRAVELDVEPQLDAKLCQPPKEIGRQSRAAVTRVGIPKAGNVHAPALCPKGIERLVTRLKLLKKPVEVPGGVVGLDVALGAKEPAREFVTASHSTPFVCLSNALALGGLQAQR